jgi:DNA helicase-2/ATP-dependent DNA helicase PcrA
MAKNHLVTPQAYKANPKAMENDRKVKRPEICNIYAAYFEMCRQAGVMDFDDLLLYMNILLRDSPEALMSIASRFDYILVDEYQDTNFAQYLILKKLASAHHNLCVVGDDSQSIYAFRGADISNILNFRRDYPDAKIFRLERNYRSTQVIVDAANSVIAHNAGRIPKNCFSEGEKGPKIHILKSYTEEEEGAQIASSILSIKADEDADYEDFAILYRTNSQSRALEEALRKRNIPYVIYSGRSFFDRAEIRDMMAYFKLAVNHNDDESFLRIVNTPARGIGDTTLKALAEAAAPVSDGEGAEAEKCSLFQAIMERDLQAHGIRAVAAEKLHAFANMINSVSATISETDALEVARKLADLSGLYSMYKLDNSVEAQSKAGNIEELMNDVQAYIEDRRSEYSEDMLAEGTITDQSVLTDADFPVVTLPQYLEDNSLISTVDMEDEEETKDKVAMMTVHSAKGLEFPYVFIAGLEENLFPSGGMFASPQDIEEERRLFYVALTRAKKQVELSFATSRMRNGQHQSNPPSRFIKEISPEYIDNPLRSDEFETAVEQFTFGGKGSYGGNSSYGGRGTFGGGRPYQRPQAPVRSSGSYVIRKPSGPKTIHVSGSTPISKKELFGAHPPVIDPNFIPLPPSSFKEGQIVEHNRFGRGKITKILEDGADSKAVVDFDKYGIKTLLLRYAKMRFPKTK